MQQCLHITARMGQLPALESALACVRFYRNQNTRIKVGELHPGTIITPFAAC